MKLRFKLLPLLLSTLLAACASAPTSRSSGPSQNVRADAAASAPQPVATPVEKPPPAPVNKLPSGDVSTVWERLRESFAMADCDADPSVETWARRFTHNPRGFESQIQAVLPRLVYVEKVASRYNVAGEFVLLPWVESHFRPVPGKRHRPAGMWQIMPITAGAMGLRVDGHYDGRMDIPAAANAVMKLLSQYHDQFGDWRVADYAYNAGEFSIRRIIRKHGMPPLQPTIPDWPVRKVTRNHLAKLLAIACVIRDPSRFHVTLPTLPKEQHLVKVDIPHSMALARAADHAGLSTEVLKKLNSAFRDGQLDDDVVSYLMLPASHAKQFEQATQVAAAGAVDFDQTTHGKVVQRPRNTLHTVRAGESLWKIARDYHVKIAELKYWNHLKTTTLRPGERLRIEVAD